MERERRFSLIVRDLVCVRGGRRVFSGVSFELKPGQGLMLTGPNGAGKTSLLRLLAGLSRPAAGKIEFGDSAAEDEIPLAERSHFVGHLNAVKAAMTVAENVSFAASWLGGDDARVPAALETLGIAHLADLPAGILSAGQRRRVGLARLLTARRPLWLLDEPTVSLDAASVAVLAGMISRHLTEGGMAVIATHAPIGVDLAQRLELGAAA